MTTFRLASISLCLLAASSLGCADDLVRTSMKIIVDEDGIPHIYASSDEDAFYAAGYQMAVDRLFQMDMTRRAALGRQSEVLGASSYEDDRLARLFRWRDAGRADAAEFKKQDPASYRLVVAWVEGVNRRIREVREGKAPLPHGFGPDRFDYAPELWDETDPLVVAKMTGFGNDLSIDREIFATIAKRLHAAAFDSIELIRPMRERFTVPPEDLPMGKGAWGGACESLNGTASCTEKPEFSFEHASMSGLPRRRVLGSNNWAIDGRFTDTGRPLIAGDPHQGFDVPGMFYALHMNSADQGGTLDVAGFSFSAVPGISLGQTQRVMWTATTSFADVMDVWEVVRENGAIRYGGMMVPIVERDEVIAIRKPGMPLGQGDSNTETFEDLGQVGVILPSFVTPVPVASPGRSLLLGWTGYRPRGVRGLLGINRVDSIAEFEAEVDKAESLNFNLVAADAQGITYRVGLDVPVRSVSSNRQPWLVLDGEDPETAWTGAFLPREKLPRSRATQRGWIVTANNDPFGFTANGRIDDDPWYYGAFFDAGWRADRASTEIEKLVGAGNATLADMQSLQTDLHESLADDLLPLLSTAHANIATDPSLAEFMGRADLDTLVDLLNVKWDRRVRIDSPGALVFHAFAHLLAEEAVADDVPLVYQEAMKLQAVYMLKLAPLALGGAYPKGDGVLQGGRDLVVLRALDRTAKWLEARFGSVDPAGYQFGDVHVTSFADSFGRGIDSGTIPTNGGETTLNVSPSVFYDADGAVAQQWQSQFGPLVRTTGTFAEDGTPELWFNAPLGNVADPNSPHASDWMADWRDGRYRRFAYRKAEVDAKAESSYELVWERPGAVE